MTNNKLTTRQLARRLRTTPRNVRRALRTIRNDHRYTRYRVSDSLATKVKKKLAA